MSSWNSTHWTTNSWGEIMHRYSGFLSYDIPPFQSWPSTTPNLLLRYLGILKARVTRLCVAQKMKAFHDSEASIKTDRQDPRVFWTGTDEVLGWAANSRSWGEPLV